MIFRDLTLANDMIQIRKVLINDVKSPTLDQIKLDKIFINGG